MPTSKDIASYPIDLVTVVERVLTSGEPVKVPCEDRKEAYRLRQQVYGYRQALSLAVDHPLREVAPQLSTKLDLEEMTLTICHADELVPQGLRKAAGNL